MEDKLLNTDQVCEMLGGISKKYLRELRKQDKIQAYVHPDQYGYEFQSRKYFKKTEVEEYIKNKMVAL